ncbi:MAG: IS630 transposase-related protein, partial [Rickettsia endosymbiont of Pentastiridius leporinus]
MSYARSSKFFGISKTTILKWEKKLVPKVGSNKPATKINMEALKEDVRE